MTYNIHPILVHFPIAFLLLYSLIILLPVQKWSKNISWENSERLLLLAGTIGVFMAKASGEAAQSFTDAPHAMIEMHELFANAVTWFYIILVIIEFSPTVISFIKRKHKSTKKCFIVPFLEKVYTILNKKWIIKLLALLGMISLFITGLIGGAMVYGPNADPIAPFILKILGL